MYVLQQRQRQYALFTQLSISSFPLLHRCSSLSAVSHSAEGHQTLCTDGDQRQRAQATKAILSAIEEHMAAHTVYIKNS